MGGGEIVAVFKGLAEDAATTGRDISESIAKVAEKTADIEDANLARVLATDSRLAEGLGGADAGAGDLDQIGGRRWWENPGTTLRGGTYYTPRTSGLRDLVNPKGGQMNCRACAMAVDLTLGRSPASALPSIGVGSPTVLEDYFGGTFAPRTLSGIVDDMSQAGDGARGIILATGKGPVGHAFNVVNDGGKVVFLDGQTGIADHVGKWSNYWVMRTN